MFAPSGQVGSPELDVAGLFLWHNHRPRFIFGFVVLMNITWAVVFLISSIVIIHGVM